MLNSSSNGRESSVGSAGLLLMSSFSIYFRSILVAIIATASGMLADQSSSQDALPAVKFPAVDSNEVVVKISQPELQQRQHTFAYLGNGACSYCHGSRNDSQASSTGREYSIWIDHDPHSDAYTTLLSPESKMIARKLGLPNAHQAKVCLDCHSVNATLNAESGPMLAADHRHSIVDGVGCESCHGPAEDWLEPHTRSGWEQLTFDQKRQFGFKETADIVTRGKTCAECHIGSHDKDMNHDLIASGHPRLLFELSAYQALMPRHWSREEDKANNSAALEAKLWSVGQVTSMIQTVELMENRATRIDAPWPELAEYGCFECHQDLSGTANGSGKAFNDGKLHWASWQRPSFELMLRSSPFNTSQHQQILAQVEQLNQEMSRPLPDREKVSSMADGLRLELHAAARNFADRSWSQEEIRNQLLATTNIDHQAADSNWDGLTQRYLGTVALRQAFIEAPGYNTEVGTGHADPAWKSATRNELSRVRNLLYFESGDGSPKRFDLRRRKEIAASLFSVGSIFDYGAPHATEETGKRKEEVVREQVGLRSKPLRKLSN